MSRVEEAGEKYDNEHWNKMGRPCFDAWMACAQFVLTELSRAEDGHGPRVWLAMMDAREVPMMDGIYFQEENAISLVETNEHDHAYVPESLLIAARAAHAVDAQTAADIIFDQSKTISEERERISKLEAALRFCAQEYDSLVAQAALAETEGDE